MPEPNNPWPPSPRPGPGEPPAVLPAAPVYPPRPQRSTFGGLVRWFLRMVFVVSIVLNLIIVLLVFLGSGSSELREHRHSGKAFAKDKIAIVRIEGVLVEGMTTYAQKQLEAAGTDKDVKAVIIRINSPGGTITASDDLHRRIQELREGNPKKDISAKPVIVSMGALAASGGYYIAMPSRYVLAEPTTITGSIGVYASFPNISEFANEHGISMDVVKAGAVKDSGSMFKKMTPQERQLWQDMVDSAYDRFLTIVARGRDAKLDKEELTEAEKAQLEQKKKWLLAIIPEETKDIVVSEGDEKQMPKLAEEKMPAIGPAAGKAKHTVKYTRYRADGGIFTAEQAKKYGLIDRIGYLDDAIALAKDQAHLGEEYRVITYDRPPTLLGALLGVEAPQQLPGTQLDPNRLADGALPRLWYLAPQSEMAGVLTAIGASK
jgi:protease-4